MSKRKLNEEVESETVEQKSFKSLEEKDVFITEYTNKGACSFTGIIKQRFTDFQVNEIDVDGKLAELTNLKSDDGTKPENEDDSNFGCEDSDDIDINVEPVAELTYPIDSVDQWKQITLLLKRNKNGENIRIEVTSIDKDSRRELHDQISRKYKKKVLTHTITDDQGKRFIIIGTNKNVDKRNFQTWPKELPQYLYAVLFKENADTISVAQKIGKKLRMNHKFVTYAGTKDRRGVTSQWISIRRVEAAKLASLNYKDKLCFGNFDYREEPLKLGDLRGNRFRLALRNVESSTEDIEKTLENFRANGFINYYGLQRFGSYSTAPTHEIGKCLLSKQWKEAVDLILKPRSKDDDVNEACKVWSKTANASQALKLLKRYRDYTVEGLILKTLASQGNTAYVNAFQKIPRNMTMMYLHSFQSLVWNRVVSRRIKEFGLNPLVGDLVFVTSEDEKTQKFKSHDKIVKALNDEEIGSAKIEDIVYPLPGYAITYPNNAIAEWYNEILAEYNVTFDQSENNKVSTLSGDYRKMIEIPEDVRWKIVHYNNVSADLILTDYQKMMNIGSVENFDDGAYKAVILEFSLSSATYATMALREITKTDTSASYQASLTFSHLQDKIPKLELE